MRALLLAIPLTALLVGCNDKQRAQELGLVPLPVTAPAEAAGSLPKDNRLSLLQTAMLHKVDLSPRLPPVASMETIAAVQTGNPSVKQFWEGAQIDATDLASLTASLNGITSALPKELSDVFDASAKTVLYQVTLDPDIVKKAGANQTPSDADIVTAAQRVLHGKTPAQVVDMAYKQIQELERTRALVAVPKAPPLMPIEGMPGVDPAATP